LPGLGLHRENAHQLWRFLIHTEPCEETSDKETHRLHLVIEGNDRQACEDDDGNQVLKK
jgi:hypothetical protein